jgi:hypothetical protein
MPALLSFVQDRHGKPGMAESLVESFEVKIKSLHGKPVINRIGVTESCGGMSPCLAEHF